MLNAFIGDYSLSVCCFEYILSVRYCHHQSLNLNLSHFVLMKSAITKNIAVSSSGALAVTGSREHTQMKRKTCSVVIKWKDPLKNLPYAVGVCTWTSQSNHPPIQQSCSVQGPHKEHWQTGQAQGSQLSTVLTDKSNSTDIENLQTLRVRVSLSHMTFIFPYQNVKILNLQLLYIVEHISTYFFHKILWILYAAFA